MRNLFVLAGGAALCIAAACGGSDGSATPPVDGPDSGEFTTDAGADAPLGDAAMGSDASDVTPIVAPDDAWTWVDFPTSKCGSGTPTGIGVNPHAGATELLIFMEGGGSCMTGDTCWGTNPGASNMAGFGAAEFSAGAKQLQVYPIFNRTIAANPLAATNMVFVPYCTGDLHGGSAEVDLSVSGTTKPTYFYGGLDMDLFVARLVATYPNMKRVILAGGSAGGFGTFLSFDKTARAFGVRVDVIDDSGPPIQNASGMSGPSVWNIELPQGCPTCVSLRDIYNADRLQQPNSRFGLMTFNRDSTIAPDFGYTVDEYPTVISTLSTSIAADKNAAILEVDLTPPDAEHVVESQINLAPSYFPWITKLLNDDPTWGDLNVTPP